MWANFAKFEEPQPTTSPWDFMNLVFAQVDAAVPPYYALLDELHQEVPAMDGEVIVDGDNQTVDAADLSPRAKALLHDYRMVQYDLSVGKRYSLSSMFSSPGTDARAASR